jgi:hypothetical protein
MLFAKAAPCTKAYFTTEVVGTTSCTSCTQVERCEEPYRWWEWRQQCVVAAAAEVAEGVAEGAWCERSWVVGDGLSDAVEALRVDAHAVVIEAIHVWG